VNNTIYFSGPHGAGKSSFIEAITKAHPGRFALYPDRLNFVKVEEPITRNRSKYVKYYHEWLDQGKFAEENPGKTVLGDRCLYDGIVYGRAFTRLGFITLQDQERNEQIGRLLFDKYPDNLVVLNPPLDVIVERLKNRWETKPKKWREENLEYLAEAHKGFSQIQAIFEGKHLLVINENMRMNEQVERFTAWFEDMWVDEPLYLNKTPYTTTLRQPSEVFYGT
jgi:thymidylate kinase